MRILGIWDGHDAGACVVENGKILVAINEERLTKKKLDIGFPEKSIKACLEYKRLTPSDVEIVACCGTQLSRILARQFPYFDKEFYKLRRKLSRKPIFEKERRFIKYFLAKYNAIYLKKFTEQQIRKKINKLGFKNKRVFITDHHLSHAASAIFTSGFERCLCITLDGVGDGFSGTVNVFNNGKIKTISKTKEKDSLGLFFEEVTTILGFRELEDEGKIMAMADYSYPIPDSKNPLLDFFKVDGLQIKAKHSTIKRFLELEKIKWNTPMERFAYMAQKTLEKHILELFKNAIKNTGIKDVCFAGGVASNIKLNRVLRLHSGAKNLFIFPQMGDGGLAIGAALYTDYKLNKIKPYKIENVYFGLDFTMEEIKDTLKDFSEKVKFEEIEDPVATAAELLIKENYLFWFQGRMEYGPRALGARSILSRADSKNIKDKLNLFVKKREWFQPFCPSILEEDALKILENYDGKPDRFMTMGYMVKPELREKFSSIINVDGSTRPQIVGNENPKYKKLLEIIKGKTGFGILLNTSFNLHGEPIVCTPQDAVETMLKTKTEYMILENFLVRLKK